MALSGSKDYTDTFTAANTVAVALRRLGVLDANETVDTTEEANALVTLNLIVKEWCALGLDNWLRQTGALWLIDPGSKSKYTLGPAGFCATAWAETELSAGALSSATSITVDSVDSTHAVSGSKIGVKLDDGSIHVTTISGGPSGSTITLASGLASAASAGNRVYTYSSTYQMSRPSRLLYASRSTLDTTNTSVGSDEVKSYDTEIEIIGMDEYQTLVDKKQKGPPYCLYYEPTMTNGTLYVWPTGDTSKDYDRINVTYNIYVDDFDATSNNAQFPPEWHNALAWQLAAEMASEYGVSEAEQKRLWAVSAGKLDTLLNYDQENASVFFTIDNRP